MEGQMMIVGTLSAQVNHVKKAPLTWRLKNVPNLWRGYWRHKAAEALGVPHVYGELRAKHIRANGEIIDYYVVSTRVVTSAGVGFLVDDWDDDSTDITTMNYHACGTGTDAESAADTALGAEATTITDRSEGVKSQPAANKIQSVATQTFTGSGAITEHGLFSALAEETGVLWDRSVFPAINVGVGDSIQWTITAEFTMGG